MILSDYFIVCMKTRHIHAESATLDVSTVYPLYLTNINMKHELDNQFAYRQHTVWIDAAKAFCCHDCSFSLSLMGG